MDLWECLGGCRPPLNFPCKESRRELLPLTFYPEPLQKNLARLGTAFPMNCAKPEYKAIMDSTLLTVNIITSSGEICRTAGGIT